MKLLLDTHAYLWWASGDKKLSTGARKTIRANVSSIFISAVSAYELTYKHRAGSLPQIGSLLLRLDDDLIERGFMKLPVSFEHGRRAGELGTSHRDPFDRLLAAQSIVENMPIVSNDEKLVALGAQCIW